MKRNSGTIKMLVNGIAIALMLSTATAFAGNVQYERHGRFLKRVVNVEREAPMAQRTVTAAEQKAEGQYYRQGRFLKRTGMGGQRGIIKREVAQGGVRHVHGLNGKSHKNVRN